VSTKVDASGLKFSRDKSTFVDSTFQLIEE